MRRISRAYEVRGMLLEITSWDNATVGSGAIVNQVRLAYNTFGQPVIEYQEHGGAVKTSTSPKVQYGTANGAANTIRPISVTYPNGRVVVWDYSTTGSTPDSLSRIARIFVDNVQVASYVYLGLGRIVQVDHPQPFIRYDLATGSGSDPYAGLDRFGRVIDCRWRDYGSGTPIDAERVQYGYDRANNRKYRENTVDTTTSKADLYGYDGMYRLKTFERGTLNAAKTALTTKTFGQQWNLDATGNWSGFNEDTNGDGTWELGQTRVSNKVNEIASFTNSPGPTWFAPSYDAAGNMTIAPVPSLPGPLNFRSQEFDAWNRLTKAVTATAVLGEFAYDGLNRRITKKTFSGGTPLNTRHFYYSQDWQVLEERLDSATTPQRQFIWGIRYIDDLLFRDRDTNADGTLDERLYGLQDDNWNLVALADTNGDIQERYRYDAYGLPTVLTPAFAARSSSLFDWEVLYASYRWDPETKMYQVRNRWLDSRVGVWVTRDPIGYRSGDKNLYRYVRNMPGTRTDPSGRVSVIPPIFHFPPPGDVVDTGIRFCDGTLHGFIKLSDGVGYGFYAESHSGNNDGLIDDLMTLTLVPGVIKNDDASVYASAPCKRIMLRPCCWDVGCYRRKVEEWVRKDFAMYNAHGTGRRNYNVMFNNCYTWRNRAAGIYGDTGIYGPDLAECRTGGFWNCWGIWDDVYVVT